MRKNLKKKLICIIEKLGPKLWKNFDHERVIVKKRKNSLHVPEEDHKSTSTSRQNTYMQEVELNNAFGSLKELGI